MYDIVIINNKSRNRSSYLMKLGFLNLKKVFLNWILKN